MHVSLILLPFALMSCTQSVLGLHLPIHQISRQEDSVPALANSTYVVDVHTNDATTLIVNPDAATVDPFLVDPSSTADIAQNSSPQITAIPPPLNLPVATNTATIAGDPVATAQAANAPSGMENHVVGSGTLASGGARTIYGSTGVAGIIAVGFGIVFGAL